jgi:glutamate-1-semialdehyde 2,1-aminomutase
LQGTVEADYPFCEFCAGFSKQRRDSENSWLAVVGIRPAIPRPAANYTEAAMCAEIGKAEIGSAENRAPKFARSRALQQRAEQFFPGGVNSPVRAFRAVGGSPPFVERAEGAALIDADGNRYIDYFGSWGPMILGHAFPPVVEAIERAARNSASFGASTAAEADLAERIAACYPAIEKMRFVSSGTEATMSAIRVARAATNRDLIIKFEGCYHGHADGLLVKAGSGVATFGIPGSAGVPEEIARLTLALPYNNLDAVEAAFAAHPNSIAAVIVEPIVGNAGCILPAHGYLAGLRSITANHGALLIVDEVMTGFRVALGGACQLYSLNPDLVTLGKIVGGGLPVGVFGGKSRFMDQLAPLGPVYQAGTLSGNPLAMAAGLATVSYLQDQAGEVYPRLEATAKALADGVAQAANQAGVTLTTNRAGSMWTWFFNPGPVNDYEQAARSDTAAFGRFHRAMLDHGIWLPPSQFEAAFISTAHGDAEVQATIAAARGAFATAQAS